MAKTTPPGKPPPRRNSKNAKRSRPSKRRPQRSRTPYIVIGAVVVAAAVIIAVVLSNSSSSGKGPTATNVSTAAGVKYYGAKGPEGVPVEVGQPLAARNSALTGDSVDGVSCNTSEQTAFHHHVHVALFVNGQPKSIPLGVGMAGQLRTQTASGQQFATAASVCFYWLHVHAQDGVVHIESPVQRPFYLGQVFALWGVTLSATQLGQNQGQLTATVNGQPWTGDPNQIPLNEHDQIVLNLGTPIVTPTKISWSGTGL